MMNQQNRTNLRKKRKFSGHGAKLRSSSLMIEPLESRELLSASPWQNPVNPLDVYGTGQVTPQDALAIINALNDNGGSFKIANSVGSVTPQSTSGSSPAPVTATDPQGLYLDVSGTGVVTPQDALDVINALNTQPAVTSTDMNVTLQAQDPNTGAVLTQVSPGESFNLVAYVQDTRTTPFGVFSAFTNVSYNSADATISSNANITPGAAFTADTASGSTATPGLIKDAGGIQGTATFPQNDTPAQDPAGNLELWSVPVTVPTTVSGTQTLTFTPSSSLPDGSSFSTSLYNDQAESGGPVINYVPAVLTVNGTQATPTFTIAPAQVTNSTSGASSLTFTVTLSQAATSTVTVNASTAPAGTGPTFAVAGTDYTSVQNQTLTFPAGTLTETFTVPIAQATQIQDNKTFLVNLSSPSSGATLGTADTSAVGTIVNGDLPTLTIPAASVTTTGTTDTTHPLVFTATLSAPSTQTVTVDYAVADGSGNHGAKAVSNYTYTEGVLTFPAGTTTETITVPLVGESNVGTVASPGQQMLTLNLFSPVQATLKANSALGTINEIPAPTPTITVGAGTGSNSTTGASTVTFPVTLNSAAPTGGTTFTYYTTDGTGPTGAVSGTDYTGVTQANAVTVTIPAGSTTATITIPVLQVGASQIGEPDKTFTLDLVAGTNGTLAATTATGTITNTDFPTVAITNSASAVAPVSGTSPYSFTVALSQASQQTVTLNYALTGTAVSGTDFTGTTSGTLTFSPGTTSQPVTVNLLNTATNGRTLILTLTNPTHVTIPTGLGSSTATISTLPAVTFPTTPGTNGSSPTSVTFTPTLSATSTTPVVISYYTTDGTAKSGTDYTGVSQGSPATLTIPAGSLTNGSITIPVLANTTIENNLTFTLDVSVTSGNANVSASTVTGTITNVNFPNLTITNASTVAASPSGSTPYTFTLNLSAPSPQTITVNYSLGGTAVSGTDYTGTATGTVTFPAGSTSEPVTVNVLNNTANTTPPTLTLTLSSPVDVNLSATTATTTINDVQSVTVANQTLAAPTTGTSTMTFTATLSNAVSAATTVNYTFGATGDSAVNGTDYTGTAGSVTIPSGSTSASFTVTVDPQTVYELNKVFTVNLSLQGSPTGVALANTTATGTITPAVSPPVVSIVAGAASENASATAGTIVNYPFTISIPTASGVATTVTYTTGGGTATAGTQYTTTTGTATILAGATSTTINVPILAETENEANSTFNVTLSNPVNATLSPTASSATGTIDNQVAAPTITVVASSLKAGATSSTGNVTVNLSAGSGQAITFSYATSDGPAPTGGAIAVAGTDYTAASGTLTIPAGTTSISIPVTIAGQTLYGLSKGFTVTLSNVTNVTTAGSTLSASETITNQVAEPSLSITGRTGTVPTGGTTFPFIVTLSAPSSAVTTVAYATANGSANSAGTYTPTSGTLTFPAGTTTETISVPVAGGNLSSNATFTVNLSSPVNATLANASATGTIQAFTPSTCSGYVFIDPSEATDPAGASTKLSTETALEGVSVLLTGTSSTSNAAVSMQTTTAANGAYSFANLTPGTYVVTENINAMMSSNFVNPEAVSGGKVVGTNQISLAIGALGGVNATNDNFAFGGAASGSTYASQRGYLSSSGGTTDGPIVVSSNTVSTAVTPAVTPAASPVVSPAVTGNVTSAVSLPSNIVQSGTTLTVTGTGGNDSFNFTAGSQDTLTFNGTSYEFDPATVKSVVFNGTGKESATVTDTSGSATANLSLGSGIVTGPGYTVTINNVAALAVNGTGADRATLHDSVLANNLFASGSLGMLTNSAGLSVSVNDFDAATVDTDGGGQLTKNLQAIDFALSEI